MLDYLEQDQREEEPIKFAGDSGSTKPQVEPIRTYKATKGDDVDEAMAKLINFHGFKLPVIRMAEGKYLIGTESKSVMIKNTTCVVRIGGGF